MPRHVFLSYCHEDIDTIENIENKLIEHGISCWRDNSQMHAGELIWPNIKPAIVSSGCLLVLLTANSANNVNVREEVQIALENNVPVIPLLRHINLDNLDEWWNIHISQRLFIPFKNLSESTIGKIIKNIRNYSDRICKVVPVFNMKGGVGKTTLAAQISKRISANHEKKVLLIDIDPQQNLSEQFVKADLLEQQHIQHLSILGLFEPHKIGKSETQYEALNIECIQSMNEKADFSQLCLPIDDSAPQSFDIIVSQFEAIKYTEMPLDQQNAAIYNFNRGIGALKYNYDYIIIDCNPSASLLSKAALRAADHILSPIRPNETAHRGLKFMWRAISDFYKIQPLPGFSIVFNFVQNNGPQYQDQLVSGLREAKEGYGKGIEFFKGKYLNTEVPESQVLRSQSGNSPAGNLSQSLDNLTQEFINRVEEHATHGKGSE